MAVKIRLRRMGQKKAPFYRIIVADSRSPRDGKFIDEIGTYDPNCDPSAIKVDEEAAKKWLAMVHSRQRLSARSLRWQVSKNKACFGGAHDERISRSDCKSAGR